MGVAAPHKSLSTELDQYREEFLRAQDRVRALVSGLDDAQFNWRPADNAWSVAECLDHLVSIGTQMCHKIDEGLEHGTSNGWTSDGPFKYGFIGNWFITLAGDSEKGRKAQVQGAGGLCADE
jgi:hypothetical protein